MKKKFKFFRYSFLNIAFLALLITILFCTAFTYTIYSYGEVKCEESINISSNISGFADKVYFRNGDSVNKGDTLITLGNKEIQLKLQQLAIEDELLTTELINSENIFLNAEKEYNRTKKLYRSGDISLQKYENKKIQYINSLYQVKKIKIQLKKLSIAISEQKLQDSYTYIIAPISGVISKKLIEEKEYITQSAPLFQIDNFEGIYFEAAIDENSIHKVQLNQKAQILLQAYSTSKYEPIDGTVSKIFPSEIDKNGKLFFPVKISLHRLLGSSKKIKIMPHMKGKSRIIIGTENLLNLSFKNNGE